MNDALRRTAAHVFVDSLEHPVLDEGDSHHLQRVLRLRDGEMVSVSDGRGAWRTCRFVVGAALRPYGAITLDRQVRQTVTIGFALPKADRPEWIVQKLTEIGVDQILILRTERSVIRWDGERADRQLAKLNKVAREASMQSRRVFLPHLVGPINLDAVSSVVAASANGFGMGIALAEPGGRQLSVDTPVILIGPEGGWSAQEIATMPDHVNLGTTILRVETAALVAAARLVALRDAG